MTKLQGYKVTDVKRSKKIGVACSSLEELRRKGAMKLQLTLKPGEKIVAQLEDGTIVDDEAYFATLIQNTLFILLLPGEDAITGAEIIYNALKAINLEYLHAGELASKFFTEDVKTKLQELTQFINQPKDKESSAKRYKSHRIDDPAWFQDLDTNADTKEKFLFKRSQDRVRGYLYKSSDDLRKSTLYKENKEAREKIDDVMANFRKHLTLCQYFGHYFDRKAKSNSTRLCNDDGDFLCRGSWQSSSCSYRTHTINPYDSREARILFSTWNLDHRVERSRSIVPAILDAANVAIHNQCCINWEYFFTLLFTTKNLKLVHIVCHDKGSHKVHCDPDQFIKIN